MSVDLIAQRLLAAVESVNERVRARRGYALTDSELEQLSLAMHIHMAEVAQVFAPRLRAADADADAEAIVAQWLGAITAPLERAGLDS